MMSVTNKLFVLSVIMLNVITLGTDYIYPLLELGL